MLRDFNAPISRFSIFPMSWTCFENAPNSSEVSRCRLQATIRCVSNSINDPRPIVRNWIYSPLILFPILRQYWRELKPRHDASAKPVRKFPSSENQRYMDRLQARTHAPCAIPAGRKTFVRRVEGETYGYRGVHGSMLQVSDHTGGSHERLSSGKCPHDAALPGKVV